MISLGLKTFYKIDLCVRGKSYVSLGRWLNFRSASGEEVEEESVSLRHSSHTYLMSIYCVLGTGGMAMDRVQSLPSRLMV